MNTKDVYGGAALVGFAGAYAAAASNLRMTSSLGIGSGAFPMGLAALLALVGCIVVAQGCLAAPGAPDEPVPWRELGLVVVGPPLFALLVTPAGVVPALFAAVFLAALAGRSTPVAAAGAIAAAIVAVCLAVFRWGLGIPLQPFGPWLAFGAS
jgi:putative tricarboxylic transport membrane protein